MTMGIVAAFLSFRVPLQFRLPARPRAHPLHRVLMVNDVFAADLAAIVYNYFHPVPLQLRHEITSFMCCGPGYLTHTLEVDRANGEQATTFSANIADVTGAGAATITNLEPRASTTDIMHIRILVDRLKKDCISQSRRKVSDNTGKNST